MCLLAGGLRWYPVESYQFQSRMPCVRSIGHSKCGAAVLLRNARYGMSFFLRIRRADVEGGPTVSQQQEHNIPNTVPCFLLLYNQSGHALMSCCQSRLFCVTEPSMQASCSLCSIVSLACQRACASQVGRSVLLLCTGIHTLVSSSSFRNCSCKASNCTCETRRELLWKEMRCTVLHLAFHGLLDSHANRRAANP